MTNTLTPEEREAALSTLDNWHRTPDRDAIERHLRFKDFLTAFEFMRQVAEHADRLDHHPEWRNCYNQVDITLITHDAGGLTDKDIALALLIDQTAAQFSLS